MEKTKEAENGTEPKVKSELKSEEEVKDLDQSSDHEKPVEKEEVEPKSESDVKVSLLVNKLLSSRYESGNFSTDPEQRC